MPNERQIFWYNLDKIRETMLLSESDFAKYIGVGQALYSKCKNSNAFLPMACIYDLAEKLNFHFTDLLKTDFHLNYLPSGMEQKILPDRYSRAAYAKTGPTKNILSYLETTRGTRAKTNLLRKFQLNEEYIQDETNTANAHLLADVVKYLSETYHFTEREFVAMGQRTPFSFKETLLKDKLGDQKDIFSILDVFFDECAQVFDKNCDYRISDIVNDFAIIEAIPKKEVLEELEVRPENFGNEQVCLTKMGCISSMTYFKYRRYSRIEKLNSMYDGDSSNKYLMDIAPFKKLSSAPSADILQFKPIYQ